MMALRIGQQRSTETAIVSAIQPARELVWMGWGAIGEHRWSETATLHCV